MIDRDRIVELERVIARQERRFAEALSRLDPSWGTITFDLADGAAVLGGPGLFVNRVFALGLDGEVTSHELDSFETRAREVGVPPSVECTDATRPRVRSMLDDRGYELDFSASVLVRELDPHHDERTGENIVVDLIAAEKLESWQETAAAGFEIADPLRRRASDVFARVAMEIDDPGPMLARSVDDGRLLGCSTLKIDDGVATLGGMATLPDERRQGVQSAMIRHRLHLAHAAGCNLALTQATTDGASERNVLRHGFRRAYVKAVVTLPDR
ncbi:MAG: GNAT family N-acetyltransferase [Acidimicrobiales bacterium]